MPTPVRTIYTPSKPLIVQVRGTSGSGKSTIIKRIMSETTGWHSILQAGRRQPVRYVKQTYTAPATKFDITIIGHYESACGGGDTIGHAREIYEYIQEVQENRIYSVIIAESLLLSEDVKWTTQLYPPNQVKLLFLDTPLQTCWDRIDERRALKGNTRPLNYKKTETRLAQIERSRLRLIAAGFNCPLVSCETAYKEVLRCIHPISSLQ